MCSQDDLDLVRAEEDGMIDRREMARYERLLRESGGLRPGEFGHRADEGHPVNTDPPKPTKPVVAQAGETIPAGAMVQIGTDGRLERYGSRRAQEHYTDVLAHARCRKALEEVARATNEGLRCVRKGRHTALLEIRDLTDAALETPSVGTRVRCLLPHRGEQGEVVAWDHDLGRPLVTWDSLRGEPPEAVEAHEYTTDLNETDFFDEALDEGRR